MKKIIIWIIAMILLVGTVNALGITPGRNSLDFTPGGAGSRIIKIVNDEARAMNLAVYVEGELKNYIQINQSSFKLNEKEDAYVEISYELPASLDPGTREANIVVRDIGEEVDGQLVISATVAVVSQFYVKVPFPGKYAEAELDIVSGEKLIGFYTRVFNKGSEEIDAKVTYSILDNNGNEIKEIKTEEKRINAGERDELVAQWEPEVKAGNYKVIAKVDYGKEIILEESFTTEGEEVKALAISVDNFVLGSVAKFNVLVENLANIDFNDISAELELEDTNGDKVANEKSLPVQIKSGSKGELIIYWDTKNVVAGSYKGSLVLKYNGKSISKPVIAQIAQNSIKVGFGLTGFVVANEQPIRTDRVILIPILIGVIIIMNIIWYVIYKRMGKKRAKSL